MFLTARKTIADSITKRKNQRHHQPNAKPCCTLLLTGCLYSVWLSPGHHRNIIALEYGWAIISYVMYTVMGTFILIFFPALLGFLFIPTSYCASGFISEPKPNQRLTHPWKLWIYRFFINIHQCPHIIHFSFLFFLSTIAQNTHFIKLAYQPFSHIQHYDLQAISAYGVRHQKNSVTFFVVVQHCSPGADDLCARNGLFIIIHIRSNHKIYNLPIKQYFDVNRDIS